MRIVITQKVLDDRVSFNVLVGKRVITHCDVSALHSDDYQWASALMGISVQSLLNKAAPKKRAAEPVVAVDPPGGGNDQAPSDKSAGN